MMDDDVDSLERECVAAALRLSGTKKRRRARDSWNETVDDDDDDTDAASKDDVGFNTNVGREIIASCVRQRRKSRRKTVNDQDDDTGASMRRNRRVTFASSSAASSDDDSDDDELKTLSDAEMERLMLAMQDALERALEREEEAMLNASAVEGDDSEDDENENKRLAEAIEAFERWKCDGEISSIDASGEEASFEDGMDAALKTADVEVLCPVCQKNRVLANKHVLFCRCGRLRISRRDEGVGLAFLKSRLARAFESHAEDGCGQSASLTFGVRDDFGMIDALCATCSECDFLEVVM